MQLASPTLGVAFRLVDFDGDSRPGTHPHNSAGVTRHGEARTTTLPHKEVCLGRRHIGESHRTVDVEDATSECSLGKRCKGTDLAAQEHGLSFPGNESPTRRQYD